MPHPVLDRSSCDPAWQLSVRTVPDRCPGRVVVEVVGEVDSRTAPVLDLCLQSQAGRPGTRELVVDLGRVTFLGLAGVQVLAQADRRCRGRGARLVVRTRGRRTALRPLELTGLDEIVSVDPGGARCRCRAPATTRRRRREPPRVSRGPV